MPSRLPSETGPPSARPHEFRFDPTQLPRRASQVRRSPERFVGIDLGTETVKVVELARTGEELGCTRRELVEHHKQPGSALLEILSRWDWEAVRGAAVSGRFSRRVNLPRVPTKAAQALAHRFIFGERPSTIISIGSHGFSVLELRDKGLETFRENSRCSQGTGNFLRQLVQRFSLTIEEASELCADVDRPAPLSGRCPVILKTDMTHLANKGEDRARILAGLFDAVCENVLGLIKPGISPPHVVLIGGVGRSRRVRQAIQQWLTRNDGMSLVPMSLDDGLFFEALGAAVLAAEGSNGVPRLEGLLASRSEAHLERFTALAESLRLVHRMVLPPRAARNGEPQNWILGFDIGSTGSKLVAMDAESGEVAWEDYRRTGGDPVGAAKALLRGFVERGQGQSNAVAFGVTGSGREVVGSLLISCYGHAAVFILNEIAAHAEGALHYDRRVDTIFEIGGQDAKYIRLAGGRIIDCAMNEACSAGTGSFIEEQGRNFAGVSDVTQLGQEALQAADGVSLGQHCSVFMAEVIDEAVAAGVDRPAIIAGLHDSIIQNYLHRVKGTRSVGQVIFCQGMPFSADALAAAVARQTGSEVIVPPNPGTVGAMGIALLTRRELAWQDNAPFDPTLFLEARVEQKKTFVCKANSGCGGTGNRCRIDFLRTTVAGQARRFCWGGACSLYDKGGRKKKLPDLAPDPFRQREELESRLKTTLTERHGRLTVAVADEFALKDLFPFFATFLHELGFDLVLPGEAGQASLKRGIREASVPFCAPMQLYHGIMARLAEEPSDFLLLPILRGVPRVAGERDGVCCPIVQASSPILRCHLETKASARIVSTVIDVGPGNLESDEFLTSCRQLAADLGIGDDRWQRAREVAARAQRSFHDACLAIGRQALDFCAERGVPAVVVLGRPYTLYNRVLNANVPTLLREGGAVAIPLECYPVESEVPVFPSLYWGYSQRMMRAAHQIRRSRGVYALFCSNYSCGPDSFNLHFCSHTMEGKPLAVIETDGHSGDAGTKTRIEAFLHCVEEDRRATDHARPRTDCSDLRVKAVGVWDFRDQERVLVPRLGPATEAIVACLRGTGVPAEELPLPDAETLKLGRRYTSGKECVPMCMTLGTLLQRLHREPNPRQRFVLAMPTTRGPCRFGVYGLLMRITLERLGWGDRVRVWSPQDADYFAGAPGGLSTLVFTGIAAGDLLLQALHYVRPTETRRGAGRDIYERYRTRLLRLLEREAATRLTLGRALGQVLSGRLFGVRDLLAAAADEFAAVHGPADVPTVLLVGEIYIRCNPAANDSIVEKLEQRGCRTRLAPFNEWVEYVDWLNRSVRRRNGLSDRLTSLVQERVRGRTYALLAAPLGWHHRTTVRDSLAAAAPYVPTTLHGEAVLTVGCALAEWRAGQSDATLNVGPHECMPSKIAEAQFYHAAERERLLTLTLPVNGEPLDPEALDSFAFEVHARRKRS